MLFDVCFSTRMHSSGMCTTCSSSHWGVGAGPDPLNFPLGCGPGYDPANFPLGCGPGSDPPSISPLGVDLGVSLAGGYP